MYKLPVLKYHHKSVRSPDKIADYFIEKYNPKKEPLIYFLQKHYVTNLGYLGKRGWDRDKIDSMWKGIINECVEKRRRVRKAGKFGYFPKGLAQVRMKRFRFKRLPDGKMSYEYV